MSKAAVKKIIFFLLMLLSILAGYTNCTGVFFGDKTKYTSTGNPGDRSELASFRIMRAVCTLLASCNTGLSTSDCETGILNTSGITDAFGISPGTYSTYSDLIEAEFNRQIVSVSSHSDSCVMEVPSMSCSSSTVSAAYQPNAPAPYLGVASLLSSIPSSCGAAYTSLPGTFGTQVTLATGNSPVWLSSSDFDQDNWPDLVVANSASTFISTYFNDASGNLVAGQNIQAFSNGMGAVISGNFNPDSSPDVIGFYSVGISEWLFGQGASRTFLTASTTTFGGVPAMTFDIDNSGEDDAIYYEPFGAGAGGSIYGYFNYASSGVRSLITSWGTPATDLAVADVINDSDKDVLISGINGTVGFSAVNKPIVAGVPVSGAFPIGPKPLVSVKGGDINGDNLDDFVTVDKEGVVAISRARVTKGNIGTPVNIPVSSTASDLALGDLNKDGFKDIVIVNPSGNYVAVLLSTSATTYAVPVMYPVGSSPSKVLLLDLNKDSKLDIIIANKGSNTISILYAN